MNIENFDRFRINNSENFVDVSLLPKTHSSDGFMLTAYEFTSEVIEVRKKNNQVAMFVMKYDEIKVPDDWKDAEVVFTTREKG